MHTKIFYFAATGTPHMVALTILSSFIFTDSSAKAVYYAVFVTTFDKAIHWL